MAIFGAMLVVLAKLGSAVFFLENATFLDEASVALTRHLVRHGLLFVLAMSDHYLKANEAAESVLKLHAAYSVEICPVFGGTGSN